MPQVIHIDGLSPKPVTGTIEPGTSLWDAIRSWGGTVRIEHVADPRYAFPVSDYYVALEVNDLLDECETWADLPAPLHDPDDPCTVCEAIRVAQELLD